MDYEKKNYDCPTCGGLIPSNEHPGAYPGAISRRDNKTEICSACGTREALEDALGFKTCPDCWEVITEKNPATSQMYAEHGGCQNCYDPTPQYQWEVTERW